MAKVSATNQLKALIVGAPEELRAELRGLVTKRQLARCARLRARPARSLEHRMSVRALRSTAQRMRLLAAVPGRAGPAGRRHRPVAAGAAGRRPDRRRPGAGRLAHAGRLRSEAAFAALAGANPILASSGQVTRHRLNRSGDRALHTIVPARLPDDPATRAYAARQLFKLLERCDRAGVEVIRAG